MCDYCLKKVPTDVSAVAVVARMTKGHRRVVRRRVNFCSSREATLWTIENDYEMAADRFIRWERK